MSDDKKPTAEPAVPLFARKVNRASLTVRTDVRAGLSEQTAKRGQ
jgi:hypothetical protein